jgi:hypothetical protein
MPHINTTSITFSNINVIFSANDTFNIFTGVGGGGGQVRATVSCSVGGVVGATPQLSIGTVSSLSSTSQPTVSITGNTLNPVLNFGLIQGVQVKFEVVFECYICSPVEGMLIPCVARNITKAGIRAESDEESPSPIVVFIMRDHNYMNKYFTSIKENDKFIVRVIGQRFELNDKYVSIIGEVVEPKKDYASRKPKLVIED